MPTIKYNKKTLMELLGRKISDDVLASRISYLGTDLEQVGEQEITVEIFPNRPDLLSESGMARALLSFMDIKPGFKKYDVKKSGVKLVIDKSVKAIRPYTACGIVKGLKLSDDKIKEIIQIQEKLHGTYGRNRKKASIGIYPFEHIKPPIYYKALHPEEIKFKPLDMNKDLAAPQILAIHPTGREYAHLLDGKEKYPIFIDSKQNIMSLVPIINSNTVGKVTLTTRDVFVECSGFEFEYVHVCLNMIVSALADMGGTIYSVDLSYPDKKYTTPELSGKFMKLDVEYVNKILGLNLKEADVKKMLARMGHDYKNGKVQIPNYRADILHPIDLVEDIMIAYGYDNVSGTMSNFASRSHERPIESFKNKVRDVLVGAGLLEVKNYHLTNNNVQSKLMNYEIETVELENSVNTDYNILRAWLIPGLFETLKGNKQYDYPQNIFEIGTVFKLDNTSDIGVSESDRLAITLCGSDANFTKIKQILDVICESLGFSYELTDTEHKSFIKGRNARVIINSNNVNSKIAYIGEIHPQILANWGLDMPVAALEINLTELFRTLFSAQFSNNSNDSNNALKNNIKNDVKSDNKSDKSSKPEKKDSHTKMRESAKSNSKDSKKTKTIKSKSKKK
jgi:phenylalanyl-tRNA synthetase beta chain